MRINKYVALATGKSRREVDLLIANQQILINGQLAQLGQSLLSTDKVFFNNRLLTISSFKTTIALNKPIGFVCSRNGQGSRTIYQLLPKKYHHLKPVGRLDKDSSGLLLLSDDGDLAHKLTHPSFNKQKQYLVTVVPLLTLQDKQKIESGVLLNDGLSKLQLRSVKDNWLVTMTEGRNRQIRRTFAHLGYSVTKLHRIKFGIYELNNLAEGALKLVNSKAK